MKMNEKCHFTAVHDVKSRKVNNFFSAFIQPVRWWWWKWNRKENIWKCFNFVEQKEGIFFKSKLLLYFSFEWMNEWIDGIEER